MSTFLIDYSIPLPGETKYNATIARMDVVKTFLSAGANFINWHRHIHCTIPKVKGLAWRLEDVGQALLSLRHIHKGDEVYFQYPHLGYSLPTIIKLIKTRKVKITLLIHDLEFLRYPDTVPAESQIKLLNSVDKLLVHTPKMKDRLTELGITTEMEPMILFDYYAKDTYRNIDEQIADKRIIAFAGNLNKSVFLRELDKSTIPNDITYRFYGVEPSIKYDNPQINYKGKFLPEHTGTIHAGWGLVWDGNEIETCSGSLGEYLRLISPHKLSLYLASGIPVIVWSQCAHAEFVKDNNVGITVDSIPEAYTQIANITEEQYKQMAINARNIGDKLRKGEFLKRLIESK